MNESKIKLYKQTNWIDDIDGKIDINKSRNESKFRMCVSHSGAVIIGLKDSRNNIIIPLLILDSSTRVYNPRDCEYFEVIHESL